MSFGHAGTIVEGDEDTATEKIARLEAAGIPVVERIDEIPDAVKDKLGVAADGRDPRALNGDLHRRRGRRLDRRRRRAGGEARRGLPGRHLRRRRRAVEIVGENLDECVLCELCLDAAPDGARPRSRSSTTAPSSGARLGRRRPGFGPIEFPGQTTAAMNFIEDVLERFPSARPALVDDHGRRRARASGASASWSPERRPLGSARGPRACSAATS